jgi:hypothetical protein
LLILFECGVAWFGRWSAQLFLLRFGSGRVGVSGGVRLLWAGDC